MTATLRGNPDGTGSILVGGTEGIQITTSQTVSFTSGALSPLKMASASLVGSPVAGTIEYDGSLFYCTDDLTDGRGFIQSPHYFRLTSDGSTISTIANFFGSTSGMALDTSTFYEIEAYLYFTKTTAGTATFTFTFSNAPINNNANYVGTPVGGVGTVGTAQTAALVKSTATAGALPATGSLSSGVNHQYIVRAMFQANASTGGTVDLRITASAGTITPLTGSYYKLTRLPSVNTGTFA
jgi:hypothetical protein